MEKIGVFGGSFNPVHREHVNMAIAAINAFSLDRLIVMPTFISPHKKNFALAPSEDRLQALEIAFSDRKDIEVSDYEIKKEGISYTYLTLEHIKEEYGGELYFLMGTDMLADFPTWKNPKEILELSRLVVTAREGENLAKALTAHYEHFHEKPLISVYKGKNYSSTKIRNYLALGLDVSEYLDPRVEKFLKERGTYGGGKYAYIAEYLNKALKKKRIVHTAGVMTLAEEYAKRLGEDREKARLAAMLHDVAKYNVFEDFGMKTPKDIPKNVIHQFLGAIVSRDVLKIEDEDVLNAVRYHTTGRAAMSTLEKIIFTADFLEEGRTFDGVERLRAAVDKDFDEGFKTCVKELFGFLQEKNAQEDIYYLSKECFEYYCK